MDKREEAELDFLRFFYTNCDFGPADGDVRQWLRERYTKRTGKPVPKDYIDEGYES